MNGFHHSLVKFSRQAASVKLCLFGLAIDTSQRAMFNAFHISSKGVSK
tara:strand:- start:3371 stop:3514 length:144 start_codon:yes stop_codon:yes gene_type:complete